jgi:hypothetical protein
MLSEAIKNELDRKFFEKNSNKESRRPSWLKG